MEYILLNDCGEEELDAETWEDAVEEAREMVQAGDWEGAYDCTFLG